MLKPITSFLIGILITLCAATSLEAQVKVEKIVIQPDQVKLQRAGDRHSLIVFAVEKDGRIRDVTEEVRFESRNEKVVQITGRECVAAGAGMTQVVADYQGVSTTIPVFVIKTGERESPSFRNDVLPVLTRMGCNQGACHGKNSGQNGFRLSLRGFAPEWDYKWLTREQLGRRVNSLVSEDSLLLKKPLGEIPHEGGKLFDRKSRTYQTLARWIRSGTPGLREEDPGIERLVVLPTDRVLKIGEEQQLLVLAEYSDGSRRDVTWLAKFAANDRSVAEVNAHGKVQIKRPGETAVRVMFQGQVAVALFTSPYNQTVPDELFSQKNNLIDNQVFAKLKALHIEPSELCSDQEFIRRVYLDTIGVLPTGDEVQSFLQENRPNKRSLLIDELLKRPEFVDFWTLKFADLLQNRKESDHDVRGTKGVRSFHQWLRSQIASNRPWNELARDILTVKGSTADNPAVGYYIVTVGEEREAHQSTVVASAAQTFLGTRIGCAQCHNHPLEKYTQDDYYHFAAFFSRIKLKRQRPEVGPTTLMVSAWNERDNKKPVGVRQPRTREFLKPQHLDRSAIPVEPDQAPRRVLADCNTSPDNDYFSGAMVNRLWAHFFAVGLVEPVDDLRASNPPSNPALWQTLNKEFIEKEYDVKHMIRLMLNSRAYQLSSKTKPGNQRDQRFYSHYYARRLPAEVFLDALSQATGVPERFPGYPTGIRAVQVPDPSVNSYFLKLFGRSERMTACACERKGEVTLPQLLHLHCGETIERKLRNSNGQLAAWLKSKKSDEQIVETIFLNTVSRLPRKHELGVIRNALSGANNRDEVLRDVFWAVLNSKEFAFNH